VVVASGLPNLLHEFAHAIQAGRVADDHGFDYGLIPLDLQVPGQRLLLWEELACCVTSCAYGPEDAISAWFKEQVEIQGVFYGVAEGDVDGFAALVEATDTAWPGELTAVVEAAYEAIERALVVVGASHAEARPARKMAFGELWERYRARLPLPAT
jgi:hypothetical protein